MKSKGLIRHLILLFALFTTNGAFGQTATPTLSYHSVATSEDIVMNAGDEKTEQAPLEVTCKVEFDVPDGYSYHYNWSFYRPEEDKENPILVRNNEEETSYTFTKSGAYEVRFYITWVDSLGNENSNDEEPLLFKIKISESSLKCPNGFSPNDDNINDKLRVSCQSIVKFDAVVVNRWGQKVAEKHLNGTEGGYVDPTDQGYYIDIWDGYINGKICKDGVYFLNLNAYGSDGLHYKMKKTINVLKGFRETGESEGND